MSAFEEFCRDGLKNAPCLSTCEICKAMWNAALDHAAQVALKKRSIDEEMDDMMSVDYDFGKRDAARAILKEKV